MSRRLTLLARPVAAAFVLGAALGLVSSGRASAHPLGNFTINHFAGLRIAPDSVSLDVVIDMAEIPAFQERQTLDRNGDGRVDANETEASRTPLCRSLAPSLRLTDGQRSIALSLAASGLSFPAGASGLPTLRLVCEFQARLQAATTHAIAFTDESYAGRIGWREIVVQGDGMIVRPDGTEALPSTTVSARLTHYPTDLLSTPLAMSSAAFTARPGGSRLAPSSIPDAFSLEAPRPGRAAGNAETSAIAGAVPGGIGERLGGVLGAGDLTPPVVVLSLLAAMVLGAAHALSPGHGKTVMAAYLVGSRGSPRQAAALGLLVTASHTAGVLGLAVLVTGASTVLPPERLYPILSVAAGLLVLVIGVYLVAGRLRASRLFSGHARRGGHEHGHAHPHPHEHQHPHEHAHRPEHEHETHGFGPFRHSHGAEAAPPAAPGWRSLVALGLAGGLVPSASALLLLLGSLAAGRAAYGVVLVVAFGAGMAVVLVGIGLALVYAGRLVERVDLHARGGAMIGAVPSLTAIAVLLGGVVLTAQALHQVL